MSSNNKTSGPEKNQGLTVKTLKDELRWKDFIAVLLTVILLVTSIGWSKLTDVNARFDRAEQRYDLRLERIEKKLDLLLTKQELRTHKFCR